MRNDNGGTAASCSIKLHTVLTASVQTTRVSKLLLDAWLSDCVYVLHPCLYDGL
jgi:hypothetical protein